MGTLEQEARSIVSELEMIGLRPDCWSIKGQGKATVDCDLAVDYCISYCGRIGIPSNIGNPAMQLVGSEIDPYETGNRTLVRLKFCKRTGPIHMVVVCHLCGSENGLDISGDEYWAWKDGKLVQHAFPGLTISERELLISSTCPRCWNGMYGEDDEG